MKSFDSINVIPFIDILLVLLAMVLITATFVNTGQLEIDLPAASTTDEARIVELTEIAIDQSEQLYLDGVALSLEQLDGRLSQRRGDISEVASRVSLMVDQQVSFQRFVSVVDLLKRLSMDDVSIVTQPAP